MYADNLSLFFSFLALVFMLASSRFTRTTQRSKHKRMERCSCLRRRVVRVNRNDASINTSASTRRLYLRRTGLHVGYACVVRVNQALYGTGGRTKKTSRRYKICCYVTIPNINTVTDTTEHKVFQFQEWNGAATPRHKTRSEINLRTLSPKIFVTYGMFLKISSSSVIFSLFTNFTPCSETAR